MVCFIVGVLDELEGFETVAGSVEALEQEGAGFDAPYYWVSADGGGLRGAGLAMTLFACFVGGSGFGEGTFSEGC